MKVDLRHADLQTFTAFVFDHPVPSDKDEPEWYLKERLEVEYEPRTQVRLLRELFGTAGSLPNAFNVGQIEQGLWFVFTPHEEYFTALLWAFDVPWPERAGCIESIAILYSDLFPRVSVETIDYMIPDLLADSYGFGRRNPHDPDDHNVREALFRLFTDLLKSADPSTQYAGLHGLGHLAHPRGREAINAYLAATPGISAELRSYASDAMTGDVL
jgi:hypothetical protein